MLTAEIRAEKSFERGKKPLEKVPQSIWGSRTQAGRGWMGGGKGKASGPLKRNFPPWGRKISFVFESKQANTCSAQLNAASLSYYLLFLPWQHSGTSRRLKGIPVLGFVATRSRRQPLSRRSDTTNGSSPGMKGGKRRNNNKAVFALASSVHIKGG